VSPKSWFKGLKGAVSVPESFALHSNSIGRVASPGAGKGQTGGQGGPSKWKETKVVIKLCPIRGTVTEKVLLAMFFVYDLEER
jgi:hypothetical protein